MLITLIPSALTKERNSSFLEMSKDYTNKLKPFLNSGIHLKVGIDFKCNVGLIH